MSNYDNWKARSPDDERDLREGDLIRVLRAVGLPVTVIDEDTNFDDLRQCDCCGEFKAGVTTIWADHVGETSACPRCRGHEETE